MNQQQKEARELLVLEIKLARLKVAASYLKQRKLKEAQSQRSMESEAMLYRLADLGSFFASSSAGLLTQASRLPLPKNYRYGALLALLALQMWQNHSRKKP